MGRRSHSPIFRDSLNAKKRSRSASTIAPGPTILIEIGATNVGSINQTFTPGQPVARGDERGYFAFGGSSTITLFEPGRVTLADDLLEHSANQIELYAPMGSLLGTPTS